MTSQNDAVTGNTDDDKSHPWLELTLRANKIKNTDGAFGRRLGDKVATTTAVNLKKGIVNRVDNLFGASDPFFQLTTMDDRLVAQSGVRKNTLKPCT